MASRGLLVGTLGALVAALALLAFATAGAGPAEAAFPGENGKIFYTHSNIVSYDPVPEFPRTDAPDVWATDPDGSSRVNLTGTPEQYEGDPASSSDGTRVAFVRSPSEYGAYDLWVMDADGAGQENLTDTPGRSERHPAWSSDGGWIAFVVYDSETRQTDVWSVRADGTGLRNLTSTPKVDERGPAFSPDGGKIAFAREGDVWVMGADGTSRENLTGPFRKEGFVGASSPSFSPDGQKIAFDARVVRGDCHYENVFTMDAGGSAWTQLTRNEDHHDCDSSYYATYSVEPVFSPDGLRIAFVSGSYYPTVAVMNRDGSGLRRLDLDASPDDDFDDFAYSPDWQPVCPCPEVPPPDEGDDDAPTVTRPRPAPGSEVRDRTPTIKAVVRDETNELAKSDIRLRVDGRERGFSYDAGTDRLSRATKKLSLGRHTVEVTATDRAGNTATERWSFRVVKRG